MAAPPVRVVTATPAGRGAHLLQDGSIEHLALHRQLGLQPHAAAVGGGGGRRVDNRKTDSKTPLSGEYILPPSSQQYVLGGTVFHLCGSVQMIAAATSTAARLPLSEAVCMRRVHAQLPTCAAPSR